jgi:3-phenylpropionate/trans-cinnamate dioxygenase ferredoxin reductase subunit
MAEGSGSLVVIGGGLAGAKAVEGARAAGYQGRVVLVSEEAHAPYERPPLSKAVLRGEAEPASTHVHDSGFYDQQHVELVTGRRVDALDLRTREVRLDTGDRLSYDAVVLATGASPRVLTVPGAALGGVHYLRTIDDAVRLRVAIRSAGRVAVVGAGWIGTEVAASARQLGADVVLVDPLDVPLQRVLGVQVGAVFGRLHADHGVVLRSGTGVTELRGSDSVEEVVLGDGSVEPADLVVVGIGVLPRVELASAAGLAVQNGVVVNEYLETDAPGVFAAGDIANTWNPAQHKHIRVEHWANALNQGMTAGRNAAGAREAYDREPYFFSDQFDLGMEYVGHGHPDDQVVVRGDVAERKFIAFWHRDGRLTAAMNVNVWDVVDDLKALVSSRRQIDPMRLADGAIPLAELV